jgi:hypothetical protein
MSELTIVGTGTGVGDADGVGVGGGVGEPEPDCAYADVGMATAASTTAQASTIAILRAAPLVIARKGRDEQRINTIPKCSSSADLTFTIGPLAPVERTNSAN